jgi:hypothetical protein
VRRTSVSNILVCRPKRPKPSLSEFLELDENEFDGQRPYITGHNRYCTRENLHVEIFGQAFEKVNVQKLSFISCGILVFILLSPSLGLTHALTEMSITEYFW